MGLEVFEEGSEEGASKVTDAQAVEEGEVNESNEAQTAEEVEVNESSEAQTAEEIEVNESSIQFAIVGCSHGELDIIYDTLQKRENDLNIKIDVLLCCGDFQAMRNSGDLAHFHCPLKYRRLGDFHKYYSGEKKAPCLTIFIGGNHESSAFSMELPHGGWVAENIYYMGFASVVNFGGLRIGGWSGIFKQFDYNMNHYEMPPFDRGQQVSAYHVRAIEKFRLSLLSDKKPNCVDIFMTHDWPVGITSYGNEAQLIRYKPYFEADIARNQLGNPHSQKLVHEIRPRYWFAGHLHCKFEATVNHEANEKCEAESETKFLALHKCNSQKMNRMFFDIRRITVDEPLSKELRYDPKWLAILRKTKELEGIGKYLSKIPENAEEFIPTEKDIKEVEELFNDDYRIPLNFRMTAEPENVYEPTKDFFGAHFYRNPQTKEFCDKLGIPDLNFELCMFNQSVVETPYCFKEENGRTAVDDNQISLASDILFDDDEDSDDDVVVHKKPVD